MKKFNKEETIPVQILDKYGRKLCINDCVLTSFRSNLSEGKITKITPEKIYVKLKDKILFRKYIWKNKWQIEETYKEKILRLSSSKVFLLNKELWYEEI